MRHQIILMGKDITSTYLGIKQFCPDHIHLIFTEESKRVAEPLYPLLSPAVTCSSYMVEPYDGVDLKVICRQIHESNEGEIRYNLTEGTKIMAFAAYHVAREYNAPAFYLSQLGDLICINSFEQSPVCCKLSNEEIIKLHGNTLLNYGSINDLKKDDLLYSQKVKTFVETYRRDHDRIQNYYYNTCKRRLENLPASHTFTTGLNFSHHEGMLLIKQEEEVILDLPIANGCMLYFEGRWWETLITEKVKEWSDAQFSHPEVWQNIIFQANSDPNQIKSEIDILINNGQKLIFIECKSGNVTQNDVYKIDSIREIYGGDISLAILASYYPLKKDLADKCRSLQITYFAPPHFTERINYLDKLADWLNHLVEHSQI